MRSWMRALLACVPVVLLMACASEEVFRPRLEVTVGQQLIDLKKARDGGALSDKECDQQRARLIDSVR